MYFNPTLLSFKKEIIMDMEYEVHEDNGGGLSLYVWNKYGVLVYYHTGYEYDNSHTQLWNDLDCLNTESLPINEWEGNELRELTTEEVNCIINEADNPHQSTKIIADNYGYYPNIMGNAGVKAFHVDEYDKENYAVINW